MGSAPRNMQTISCLSLPKSGSARNPEVQFQQLALGCPGSLYGCELSLGCSCLCLLLTPQFLALYPCVSMKPPFRNEMPSLCWTFDNLVLPTQTYHSRDQMGTPNRENTDNNNSQTDTGAHLLAQRPVSDKRASPHFPGFTF